jgi:hypothetical protein
MEASAENNDPSSHKQMANASRDDLVPCICIGDMSRKYSKGLTAIFRVKLILV